MQLAVLSFISLAAYGMKLLEQASQLSEVLQHGDIGIAKLFALGTRHTKFPLGHCPVMCAD